MNIQQHRHFINLLAHKSSSPQAYRVWDQARRVKKGIVATSLKELKERGRDRHGYYLHEACDLKVVVEACGTEVNDEAYFRSIPANTILLLLNPSEKWSATSTTQSSSSLAAAANLNNLTSRFDKILNELTTPETESNQNR